MNNHIENLRRKTLKLVTAFFDDVDDDYGYIINSNKASLTSDFITYLQHHLEKKKGGK